jgi:N utilization substance protein B
MRVESRARARALQALYAWDLRGNAEMSRVASNLWDDLKVVPSERKLAARLLDRLEQSVASVDAAIVAVTPNWRLERLGVIERSILRLGTTELQSGETPARVVIQESVRLAERYGSDASARFVNGVLDAVARRMNLL